jgi:tetratricopeptide (TPR) repeat protein
MSGNAGDVVQARDISGGIHFHRSVEAVRLPQQLPGAHSVFVNREAALVRLDAALSGTDPRFAVIVGMPGVGKTSLALHWARRYLERFPDGQLYLNLHGYDASPLVGPHRALSGFLLALGMPRGELAVDVDEAATQYRSLLAGRRVLIVLDNAREADQVRPLLPGTGGCTVLVTSRDHMPGLVARDGARRIDLDVLAEEDAAELLVRLTEAERPNDPRPAVGELAGLCGRLPLALRVAAEHALSRPWDRLEDLVTDLRGQSPIWEVLTVEERSQDAARSVFAWSYLALPGEAARVFRALALHPGPDFSGAAAAALAALHSPRHMLGVLVGAHLLERQAGDRFQFHDLVRSYALDQARDEEPPERLRDASRRLLLWYLRSADAAQPWVNPAEARVVLDTVDEFESAPEAFGSYEEAVGWFERERDNLLAAVRVASEQEMHEIAWKLAVVLRVFYMRFSAFEDWLATSGTGLRSAELLDDLPAQAELLESLGMAYSQAFDLDRGEQYQHRALEIRRQVGDRLGVALSLNGLGLLQVRRHHSVDAQAMFREALDILATLREERWVPVVQENLAEALIDMEGFLEAEGLILAALTVFRERGDTGRLGNALRLQSMVSRGVGDVEQALDAAAQAVELAIRDGNPGREGFWLLKLGAVQRAMGRATDAVDTFRRSAALQRQIGHKVREAQAWDAEGGVQRELGHLDEATGLHSRAAQVFRSLDARWLLARALANLADALSGAGQVEPARERSAEAVRLLVEFSDPEAERLKVALRRFS